jgi:type IV pilus assembly protein PilM
MDLKKEIKLSDLLPKRRNKAEGVEVRPEQPKQEKPKQEKLKRERRRPFARSEASVEHAPKQPRRQRSAKPKSNRKHGRKTKLVGLKIGASQIAAAQVANNGGAHVLRLARQDLDPGVVVGGELRDPDVLAAALRQFFRKNNLPRQNVRLGISNNRIGVRMFEIGGIDDRKQLANAIRYRAQEVLPIPIEEAVLDYHILSEYTDGDGQLKRRVLLVVAYRDLIDRYFTACKKAGIKLAGIDLEAFAILRALAPPADGAADAGTAARVVVSVGHDRTTFAVSDGSACQFTRVLDWGGASLNSGIARALDLAPSEAAPIKLAFSLAEPTIPAGLTSEQAERVRAAVLQELHAFARELVSSLQFYQSQAGSLGIGEIVLTGGTADLPGFAAELAKLIGVRVRVGDPLANVKVSKKVDRDVPLGSLAAAIGLGIEVG